MKEKFIKFLELHDTLEEFCTEMRECEKTSFRTISELYASTDNKEEMVAEAFDWKGRPHWADLDYEWREVIGGVL